MKWPDKKLGSFLTYRKETVQIDDDKEYKLCRVQWYGQGVIERGVAKGFDIKTKTQQVCKSGDFIVAEIDAKEGGFGIVPAHLDGAIVSNHYFLFDIDPSQIEPAFLGYYVRLPAFREQVAARGSTNYSAVRASHVLDYVIPLPPLAEQRRIVAKIERVAGKVEEARGLRRRADDDKHIVMTAAYRAVFGARPTKDWIRIDQAVVDIDNGWSPVCLKNPAPDASWGVLRVGAISFGEFRQDENKELPPEVEPRPEYEIRSGDFLMSRANTLSLVGACALVGNTRARLMLSDKIFRFSFHDDGRIDPAFLNHVLKSPPLREQIEAGATGTSPSMKNIAKWKIMALRIPLPDPVEQRRIITHLDSVKSKVALLQSLQQQTAAELDALLPAVLDRAFRGEL